MSYVEVYTDGSSRGNPGPGGYGVVLKYGDVQKELAEGFLRTTNNRMELMAVIVGLETLTRPCQVLVVSDSKYVVDSVEKHWIDGWERKDFKGVKNPDLWQRYLRAAKQHSVRFQWVKGHATHVLNNRCDVLATQAALKGPHRVDAGME
ncbi:MAG: ribonuclease HI [Schleiferiaceae bacterium]|jgi:ribonuclease HI|nr:ribonuclease HI [Schleiferiaceae bacterium]MDP4627848.1 ribonuclease HI [Schleiferiaceae bacterium]MDP4727934.1 ribonuclease HI [Schleiferiaceae bacterium]MDP4749412.1 ribonuclease HI [Schleiferiaceae bacterium]MDP4858847.1 ribonuclease HI [Schleiferiaceae bacterium]